MESLWTEYLALLAACASSLSKTSGFDWAASFTVLTASIAALIAYLQVLAAREQVRVSLFEKRLIVFNSIKDTAGALVSSGDDLLIENRYFAGVRGAEWLFDKDVTDYLKNEFEPRLREWFGLEREAKVPHRQWFNEQLVAMDDRFAPYLSFKRAVLRQGKDRHVSKP